VSDFDPSAPLTWPQFKACWQELDRRVSAGELTAEDAVRMAYEVGLVCPQNGQTYLPHEIREVMAFYPDHIPDPPLGPWLLVAFADSVLAGTHVYRPVSV
jgi:hypothetical protein